MYLCLVQNRFYFCCHSNLPSTHLLLSRLYFQGVKKAALHVSSTVPDFTLPLLSKILLGTGFRWKLCFRNVLDLAQLVRNDRNAISNQEGLIVLDTKQRDTLCNITIFFSSKKIVFLSRLTNDYLSDLCQEWESLIEEKVFVWNYSKSYWFRSSSSCFIYALAFVPGLLNFRKSIMSH